MKYAKYAHPHGGKWTEWILPLPSYRMRCCDCHLVHDVQFQVVKVGKLRKHGYHTILATMPSSPHHIAYRVRMRVARNERATATAASRRSKPRKASQ